MHQAVGDLAPVVGTRGACLALGVAPATLYRHRRPRSAPPAPRAAALQPRALQPAEREAVLAELCSQRFVDSAPAQVWATLMDEGRYLCSERTMYRLLSADAPVRERRNQLQHPPHRRPELLAERPNQLWSWDITKLLGPTKWTYLYLYVILDVFSRYVVGWALQHRESARIATALIEHAVRQQQIAPTQLTLHADRGSSMTSRPVALLLADLGVTKTHSRPYTSADNPFSEAHFKTLKYRPDFPERFASIEEGRAFCRAFFAWYNHQHRHSGIAYMTPFAVHTGEASAIQERRAQVLADAYAAHPHRFVRGLPRPPQLPGGVWINPPSPETMAQ